METEREELRGHPATEEPARHSRWVIHLKENTNPEVAFSQDEVARMAQMKMVRSMARFRGSDARS
jgi:hypothetical protein